MQLNPTGFIGLIQDRWSECVIKAGGLEIGHLHDVCFNPSKHPRIIDIFHSFLTKNSRFGNCVENQNTDKEYSCPSNDGTNDQLALYTNPNRFGMGVVNGQRWLGYSLTCVPSRTGYFCYGELPHEKEAYQVKVMDNICEEHFHSGTGSVKTDCRDRFSLFDLFPSHTPFEKTSLPPPQEVTAPLPQEATASLPQEATAPLSSETTSLLSQVRTYSCLTIGTAGTLYFGCKTIVELNNLWKAFQAKKSDVDVTEQQNLIQNSKKRALVNGVAALAAGIFTAYCTSSSAL